MSAKLFLNSELASVAGTAPAPNAWGHAATGSSIYWGSQWTNLFKLSLVPSASAISAGYSMDAQTPKSCPQLRFASAPITVDNIAAQTWSFKLNVNQGNVNQSTTWKAGVALGVYRPSTGQIVATILDTIPTISAQPSYDFSGSPYVVSIPGSAVNSGIIQPGDILYMELWIYWGFGASGTSGGSILFGQNDRLNASNIQPAAAQPSFFGYASPYISAVLPGGFDVTGGTQATLTGSGFAADSDIYVDGVKLSTTVSVQDAGHVSFFTPSHILGTATLEIFSPTSGESAYSTLTYQESVQGTRLYLRSSRYVLQDAGTLPGVAQSSALLASANSLAVLGIYDTSPSIWPVRTLSKKPNTAVGGVTISKATYNYYDSGSGGLLGSWAARIHGDAGSFPATTWTFRVPLRYEAAFSDYPGANQFGIGITIWRPSTGQKIATLRDAWTGLTENAAFSSWNPSAGRFDLMRGSFSTSQASGVQDGDLLVVELYGAFKANHQGYGNNIALAYDGSVVPSQNNNTVISGSDWAAFIQSSATLSIDVTPDQFEFLNFDVTNEEYADTAAKTDETALAKLTVTGVGGVGLNVKSQRVINLGYPISAKDLVNKQYVDDRIGAGFVVHTPARLCSTTNVDVASAPSQIDGITAAAGNRVLLTGQTDFSENGIYVYSAAGAPLARAADGLGAYLQPGSYFFINEGTTNQHSAWVLINDSVPVIGTDLILFDRFSGLGQVVAGAGLTKTGDTVDVGKGDGIGLAADKIFVDFDTIPALGLGGSPTYSNGKTVCLSNFEAGVLNEVPGGPVYTTSAGAVRSTADAKFGAASLLLTANSDYVEVPNTAGALNASNCDFEMEMWIKPTSVATQQMIFSNRNGDTAATIGFCVYIQAGGALSADCFNGSARIAPAAPWAPLGNVIAGQWNHIYVSRFGNKWYMGLNGAFATGTGTAGAVPSTGANFRIGKNPAGAGALGMVGYVDSFAFRYWNYGQSYTGTYVPPTSPLAVPVLKAEDIPADIVDYSFDGAPGGTVAAGSLTYTADRTGAANKAATFNGATSLRTGKTGLYPRFSVTAWVYPTSVASTPVIATKINTTTSLYKNFEVRLEPTQKVSVHVPNGSAWSIYYSTYTVPLNKWSHVAVSYDGYWLRIWINGIQDSEQAAPGYAEDTTEVGIGSRMHVGQFFSGKLDGVKIFARAIEFDEVTILSSLVPRMATLVNIPTSGTYHIYQSFYSTYRGSLKANTTYTFSVYVKTDTGTKSFAIWRTDRVSWSTASVTRCTATTSWQRFSVTFNTGTSDTDVGMFYDGKNVLNPSIGNYYIACAQLEEGSVATDYLGPSPMTWGKNKIWWSESFTVPATGGVTANYGNWQWTGVMPAITPYATTDLPTDLVVGTGSKLKFLPDSLRGLAKDALGAYLELPGTSPGLKFDTLGNLALKLDAAGALGVGAFGAQVYFGDENIGKDVGGYVRMFGIPRGFQVGGVPTTGTSVTAAKLTKVTDGSLIITEHVHSPQASVVSVVDRSCVAGANIQKGSGVYVSLDDTLAQGSSTYDVTARIVGVAGSDAIAGGTVDLQFEGIVAGVLGGTATRGTRYFLGPDGNPTLIENLPVLARVVQLGIALSANDLMLMIVDYGKSSAIPRPLIPANATLDSGGNAIVTAGGDFIVTT